MKKQTERDDLLASRSGQVDTYKVVQERVLHIISAKEGVTIVEIRHEKHE